MRDVLGNDSLDEVVKANRLALAKLQHRDRLRRGLIEAVRIGRRTPEAAERQAMRAGLEPFEKTPDPTQFHPTSKGIWTVPMALALILWGTPEAIMEQQDDYTDGFLEWAPCSYRFLPTLPNGDDGKTVSGFELRRRPPAFLNSLELAVSSHRYGEPHTSLDGAKAALINAGSRGCLSATGIDAAGNETVITSFMESIAVP